MYKNYFAKMRGGSKNPPGVSHSEIMWSWIGSFLGILAVSGLDSFFLAKTDLVMIIASFGASAVLIYGAVKSPLAQPRNLIGGHIVSALIGVSSYKLLHSYQWLSGPLAVATAIALMHSTKTLHPPGGATALIAVIGSEKIHNLGYLYVFFPAGAGAFTMLIIALLINNIPKTRKYPEFWL
ncbi:MAG: HPP family protein [Candidatus Tectomicrobia bacterium]|uniref:HPP family protein n=1 Tax=Tectimicrobiota bacterium TaxID=2528274 RepID=A0A933LRD4_UNCTE|nr:HPP family protein [Candidatus Tectomicrobia bacterium]